MQMDVPEESFKISPDHIKEPTKCGKEVFNGGENPYMCYYM